FRHSGFVILSSFVIRHSDENPVGAHAILCHLRSTWMDGSPSTQLCCSPTSSASSRWDFGSDDEIETWRISRSARGPFPGGRCSLRSLQRRRAPRLFSGRPPKVLKREVTSTANWRSERFSHALASRSPLLS